MEGLLDNMPMEEYHATDARSASNLITQEDSTCELSVYEKEHRSDKQTTAQFDGTGIHSSMQAETEEEIDRVYRVAPDVRKNSKAWTQWYEEECGDCIPITKTQMTMFKGCREAAHAHPEAALFLENGFMERSGFCELMDVQVKARPDIDCAHVPPSQRFPCLVDIKTRKKKHASSESWLKDFYFNKTYLQAGLQILVWRELGHWVNDYYYILVEREPPFQVNVIPLGEDWMHQSIIEVHKALEKWKTWLGDGSPPSYGLNQPAMELPPWMRRKLEGLNAEVVTP